MDAAGEMDAAGAADPDLVTVQAAYGSKASLYIDAFGSVDTASEEDRRVIAEWASTLSGPVLDAGCGPGHWSAFLRAHGLLVAGVDATPEFVAHATRTYPDIPFRSGDLRSLDLAPRSLGGVLAWFSLIHMDPDEAYEVLRLLAAALRPGGTILIGFFSDETLHPFDHRVVTAWAWPPAAMASAVDRAGLVPSYQAQHRQPNGRTAAELIAGRPARSEDRAATSAGRADILQCGG